VSDYSMRNLHTYLDAGLKNAKTDDEIKTAINDAFNKVEDDWY
jgi:hypothetical protein